MPRRALKISLAGENAPGVRRQQPEQVEFGAGQLDGGPVQPGLAHRVVDHQATRTPGVCCPAAGAPASGASLRRNRARMRASSIRGRTGFAHRSRRRPSPRPSTSSISSVRGEHQDRTVELRAHLAADGQAVLARQHQVEHHQVRAFGEDTRRRQYAVGFDVDLQAVALWPSWVSSARRRSSLDDQDAARLLAPHSFPSYRGPGAAARLL